MRLSMYVDDVSIGAGGQPDEVVAAIGPAFHDLVAAFRTELFIDLAPAKGRTVASSGALARRLARVVGASGGHAVDAAVHLGIDAAAGKRRAVWGHGSSRDGRLRKAMGRTERVLRLRRAGGERAKRIASSGIRPQAAYGAEVHGVSNAELRTVRAKLLRVVGPSGSGHSSTLLQMVVGDPAHDIAVAPILRWAAEVWASVTGVPNALKVPTLRAAGEAAQAQASQRWCDVRGPVQAAKLSLARLGWSAEDPFTLVDDQGTRHVLSDNSPAFMASALRSSRIRQLERAALGVTDDPGARLFSAVARLFCAHGGPTPPHQQAALMAVLCGAVWPAARLFRHGLADSPICALCGAAPDTIWHRTWECVAGEVVMA